MSFIRPRVARLRLYNYALPLQCKAFPQDFRPIFNHQLLVTARRQHSTDSGTELKWTPLSMASKLRNALPTALGAQGPVTSELKAPIKIAYIAFGSNLGDRVEWIEKALNEMPSRGISITRTSSLWETDPMYVQDQGHFLNGVCEVETTLGPIALLDELQSIENSLGRQKIIDKGPRNIDLDILLYGEDVVDHERLKIPHALMLEREFVLRPLSELIPNRALDQKSPWKLTQDYLNSLPPSYPPISTITPLRSTLPPLRPLKADRKAQVMAIMNLTPDSFSNESLPNWKKTLTSAFIEPESRIIDIGGQSTRPGAESVDSTTEIERILSTIKLLHGPEQMKIAQIPRKKYAISIDTFRAPVAEAAILAGADIINDVSAGMLDPDMLQTVAHYGKTICLMHMRGTPETMGKLTDYPDGIIPTVARELLERVAAAEAAGIRRWRIILDPGIGFAKTVDQNLELLQRLDELREWPGLRGLPWLIGSSRKGFIGSITNVEKPSDRFFGTAVTVAAAVQGGADIVRVHDVKVMVQVVKMANAIWRRGERDKFS